MADFHFPAEPKAAEEDPAGGRFVVATGRVAAAVEASRDVVERTFLDECESYRDVLPSRGERQALDIRWSRPDASWVELLGDAHIEGAGPYRDGGHKLAASRDDLDGMGTAYRDGDSEAYRDVPAYETS